jgi:hypothetical protein
VSLYDSYGKPGWLNLGGTSASSPFVAGVEGLDSKFVRTLGAEAFYRHPSSLFDVTTGSNGSCTPPEEDAFFCTAEVSYDGPTGWGTPDGAMVFNALAPAAVTEEATKSYTSATLKGAVNPENLETTYHFEYGPTSSYGKSTPARALGASTTYQGVTEALSELQQEATYHYRLVASNSEGTTDGEDRIFVTGQAWSGETMPSSPGVKESMLERTSCSSSTACTSVGSYVNNGGVRVTLAERWNGTKWQVEPTPDPVGARESRLRGVSCPSATECIAVGDYVESEGTDVTLAERWSGGEWRILSTQNETGSLQDVLYDVSCSAPAICTAVGEYVNSSGQEELTLAERLEGSTWTIEGTPNSETGRSSDFNVLRGVSCSSASRCFAVGDRGIGGVSESLAETWNGSQWTPQSFAHTATNELLNSVSCSSETACTAVGQHLSVGHGVIALAERLNGETWEQQSSINPAGATTSHLTGVSCVAQSECVAGGWYETSAGTRVTLAEKWTSATEWSEMITPNPSGAMESYLQGISCTSGTACIASGYDKNSSGTNVTLVEQLSGTEWKVQPIPNLTGVTQSVLGEVSCTSPSACTTVGLYISGENTLRTLAERWNGSEWKVQATPDPSRTEDFLQGVSCPSSTECIAVGQIISESRALAERWNGTEWSVLATPNTSSRSTLLSVSCSSPTNCTAVGNSESTLPLAERWNGTEWKTQTTPNPIGSKTTYLAGVSCTSASSCTAVGLYEPSTGVRKTLAESWNGSEWKIQSTANPGSAKNELNGVSCTSSTACTASGWYVNAQGIEVTLVERWNGNSWTVQATPNPSGAKASSFNAVSCGSSSTCTAVGTYTNSSGAHVMLAESWTGSEWRIQSTPSPSGALESELNGVSCSSLTCTTTGVYENSEHVRVTLAEGAS